MKNGNASKRQNCCCPHCETELKNRCLSPEFCEPCYISSKNSSVKICPVCKSEYANEYEKCPACAASKK